MKMLNFCLAIKQQRPYRIKEEHIYKADQLSHILGSLEPPKNNSDDMPVHQTN